MMFGAIYTAYSGTVTNSLGLNVTSNNLANISTLGFKGSTASFSQMMADSGSPTSGNGNPKQIGLGARTASITRSFAQGPVQNTGQSTNVALLGEGFFVTAKDGVTEYTRAGNFLINENGELLASNGAQVQGWSTKDENGHIINEGEMSNLLIDYNVASPPRPTTTMRLAANLAANAVEGETYKTSVGVWDATGVEHQVDLNFRKTGNDGEWTYTMTSENGVEIEGGSGLIQFDSTGSLASMDGIPIEGGGIDRKSLTLSGFANGAPDLSFEWDMVNRENLDHPSTYFTSYSDYSSTGTLYQDGFSSGSLQDVSFRQDGTLMGFYTNGDTIELGRIGVVGFNNPNGLIQADGSYFRQTGASGEPELRNETRVSVLGNAVENSNVDIAEEMTSLMVYQRGYQGNSKVITTSDQMLQEVLGLKR